MGLAGGAVLVTLVAVLGDLGVLPTDPQAAAASGPGSTQGSTQGPAQRPVDRATLSGALRDVTDDVLPGAAASPVVAALPAESGTGRRVVFDISEQRVWLVEPGTGASAADDVQRTYLVSGSVFDNLQPGTYEVYSRSRHAVGIDDSGTMEYFVRFTRGANAAIGFHSIPTKDGRALQSRAQLGTPLSHGCIRQARPDAIRLWRFAPVGTTVVVTA